MRHPSLRIITDATAEPVTLAEALMQVRQDADAPPPDQSLLQGQISAARERAEHFCNRFFTNTVAAMFYRGFLHRSIWRRDWDGYDIWYPPFGYWAGQPHHEPIRFPVGSIASIDSLKYIDPDGVLRTMTPVTDYVFNDDPNEPSIYLPPSNTTGWPKTIQGRHDAVQIQFHGAPTTKKSVKIAIFLTVGAIYEARENSVLERGAMLELPDGAKSFLWPLRCQLGL